EPPRALLGGGSSGTTARLDERGAGGRAGRGEILGVGRSGTVAGGVGAASSAGMPTGDGPRSEPFPSDGALRTARNPERLTTASAIPKVTATTNRRLRRERCSDRTRSSRWNSTVAACCPSICVILTRRRERQGLPWSSSAASRGPEATLNRETRQ